MKRKMADCENFNRRDFLHVGGLSMMGLGLSHILANDALALEGNSPLLVSRGKESKPVRNVIMIWLSGGPSTIDMWDLKPNAIAGIRGEFRPIDTNADGVQICEHLPKIAKQMQHATLVRSVSHTIAEHGLGTEYVMTGNPISPALKYPSIGSVVSHRLESATGVPSYVDLTGSQYGKAGYLGSSFNPAVIDGFQSFGQKPTQTGFELPDGFTVGDLKRRSELLSKLDDGFRRFDQTDRASEMSKFQQKAIDILRTGKTKDALDLSKESAETRARYGGRPLGRSALAARRLIEAGVRFVTIGIAGWDTHGNNFGTLRNNLLPTLDTALSALIEDLEAVGLLDETIVYCTGEFNRTPVINSGGGRDHWARSMSMFLAGGQLKRGMAYGTTDKNGFEPDQNGCSPTDVNATILNQLNITPDSILRTKSGRPVEVFRNGTVLEDLVEA